MTSARGSNLQVLQKNGGWQKRIQVIFNVNRSHVVSRLPTTLTLAARQKLVASIKNWGSLTTFPNRRPVIKVSEQVARLTRSCRKIREPQKQIWDLLRPVRDPLARVRVTWNQMWDVNENGCTLTVDILHAHTHTHWQRIHKIVWFTCSHTWQRLPYTLHTQTQHSSIMQADAVHGGDKGPQRGEVMLRATLRNAPKD